MSRLSAASDTASSSTSGALRGGRSTEPIIPATSSPNTHFVFADSRSAQLIHTQQNQGNSDFSVASHSVGTATTCTTVSASGLSLAFIARPRPKGLLNVGNSCYANAVLQCLLSTALTQALLDPKAGAIFRGYSSNPNMLAHDDSSASSASSNEGKKRLRQRRPRPDAKMRTQCKWLTRELKRIALEYHQDDEKENAEMQQPEYWQTLMQMASWNYTPVVDPGCITRHPDRLSPCLRPYQQEDAHEFMRALLSALVMQGQNKRLSSLFDGLLESSVQSACCGRYSLTRDRYMDLSLDIHQKHVTSLSEAMLEFTAEEVLDGDNCVYCKHCREKKPAKKALRLATAPSILVCHLKRFALNSYGELVRVNKHVSFPERLHIGRCMSKVNKSRPPPYDLVSLLVHQGSTCDSGHYVAFSKHGGEWYQCNDSAITKVSVQTVMKQQAYILMYEVADMRENHGYPSPHVSTKREGPASTLSSGLFCGIDDSFLGDVCCYDTTTSLFPNPTRNSSKIRKGRSRDDLNLTEQSPSTTKTANKRHSSVSDRQGRFRRASSVSLARQSTTSPVPPMDRSATTTRTRNHRSIFDSSRHSVSTSQQPLTSNAGHTPSARRSHRRQESSRI